MEKENTEKLLVIFSKALKDDNFKDDNKKINCVIDLLKKSQDNLLSTSEISVLEKEVMDLEIKYDEFNELSYYFDSLIVMIKRKVHNNNIKKIREENKKKEG